MSEKSSEVLVRKARQNLSKYGFNVAKPVMVKEVSLNKKAGGRYIGPVDTILVDLIKNNDKEEIIIALEHELLHKWQFDLEKQCVDLQKTVNLIEQNYEASRQFFEQADLILPDRFWEIQDAKIFRYIVAYIELVEDHPEFEKPEEEISKLEAKAQEIHDKMLEEEVDIDDPNDERAQYLNDKLNSLREEIRQLRSKPRKTLENFLEEEIKDNRKEIDYLVKPLEKRLKMNKRLSHLSSSFGEAMSYFWSLRRWGHLDKSRDQVTKQVELISQEDSYDTDMKEYFERIYGDYRRYRQENLSEDEAFKNAIKKAAARYKEDREKLLEK